MQAWEEVRAWREAQRAALIARRLAIPRGERARCSEAIAARLAPLLSRRGGPRAVGFYWPFRGEHDPRPLMRALRAMGLRPLLPALVERARPLEFREWWPGIRMTRGVWNIPVPAEGAAVLPDAVVAPLVGFDDRGYRLGCGGGYYDRTLAALPDRPFAVGVGFELARMETIRPQPHDVPMDLLVTERTVTAGADAAARRMDGNAAPGRRAGGITECAR